MEVVADLIDLEGDEYDDEYYDLFAEAMAFGDEELFDIGRELCRSVDEDSRITGADLLRGVNGQRIEGRAASLRFEVLVPMLADPSVYVLCNVIGALANLEIDGVLEAVAPFIAHEDEDVRLHVVVATSFRPTPFAVDLLISAMADESSYIRDWATFELSGLEVDTPRIRQALWSRAEDEDVTVRLEALCGLAERGEVGVTDRLLDELEGDAANDATPTVLWRAVVTCAEKSTDRRFRRHLRPMLGDYGNDQIDMEFEDAVLRNFTRRDPEWGRIWELRRERREDWLPPDDDEEVE